MEKRKILGFKGEFIAAEYLLKNNYKVLEKNLKISRLEIDIVAEKDDELIFVEVKTRSIESLQEVDHFLNRSQINRIKRAMVIYSEKKCIDLERFRFDFIIILVNKKNKKASLRHLIDVLK